MIEGEIKIPKLQCGDNHYISLMRSIREVTRCGLKEAMDYIESGARIPVNTERPNELVRLLVLIKEIEAE
jgi:ribosomal protein L7/L12